MTTNLKVNYSSSGSSDNWTAIANGSKSRQGDSGQEAIAISQLVKCLETLRVYAAPALTTACMIGSWLILVSAVKRRRELKPKYYVLVALTLADCLTILTSAFFNQFLHYGLGTAMPHTTSDTVCKLWSLLWIASNSLSANLLCFLAADRLFAIASPLRHLAAVTQRRYCLALAAVCVAFFTAAAFGAMNFTVYDYLGQRHCYLKVDLPKWVSVALQSYVTLVFNGLVSGCLLLVANIILAWRICFASRVPGQRYLETGAATEENPRQFRGTSAANPREIRGKSVRTGVTLMATSAAHLAGSLPRAVTYLVAAVIEYSGLAVNSQHWSQQLELAFQLASCFDYLFYANCSLNWLIYCANVPDLRLW